MCSISFEETQGGGQGGERGGERWRERGREMERVREGIGRTAKEGRGTNG